MLTGKAHLYIFHLMPHFNEQGIYVLQNRWSFDHHPSLALVERFCLARIKLLLVP